MRFVILIAISGFGSYAQHVVPNAECALAALLLCLTLEITFRTRSFLGLLLVVGAMGVALSFWQTSVHVSSANYEEIRHAVCRADSGLGLSQEHNFQFSHRILVDLVTLLHRDDRIEVRLLQVRDDWCTAIAEYSFPGTAYETSEFARRRERYSIGLCEGVIAQTAWHAGMVAIGGDDWTRTPYIRRWAGKTNIVSRGSELPQGVWCVVYAEGTDLPPNASNLDMSDFLKLHHGQAIVVAALVTTGKRPPR